MRDMLFARLQYLIPKFWMTALIYRIARIRQPRVKNWLIRNFIRVFKVDLEGLERPVPDGFSDFNDFFTRELSADARPVDPDPRHCVSPVDGRVSQCGAITEQTIVQAKGLGYSVSDLLAVDLAAAESFQSFATIYLAPFNYHRVHMPLDGRLVAAHYVPGALFSVNRATAANVPGLFARNERLNMHFETAQGPFFLSMVGALNVGSITTPWTGEIRPRSGGSVEALPLDGHPSDVRKGDLLGWFNMGSTVILMGGDLDWGCAIGSDVRMGESIAKFPGSDD